MLNVILLVNFDKEIGFKNNNLDFKLLKLVPTHHSNSWKSRGSWAVASIVIPTTLTASTSTASLKPHTHTPDHGWDRGHRGFLARTNGLYGFYGFYLWDFWRYWRDWRHWRHTCTLPTKQQNAQNAAWASLRGLVVVSILSFAFFVWPRDTTSVTWKFVRLACSDNIS